MIFKDYLIITDGLIIRHRLKISVGSKLQHSSRIGYQYHYNRYGSMAAAASQIPDDQSKNSTNSSASFGYVGLLANRL